MKRDSKWEGTIGPCTAAHPPNCRRDPATGQVDVFCLIKYWHLTRRTWLWQREATVMLLQREMLNMEWHWAASPAAKFRIRSCATPEVINSGLCSASAADLWWICLVFLPAVTQKTKCAEGWAPPLQGALHCWLQTCLHSAQLLLPSWAQIISHTHDLPQQINSSLSDFF